MIVRLCRGKRNRFVVPFSEKCRVVDFTDVARRIRIGNDRLRGAPDRIGRQRTVPDLERQRFAVLQCAVLLLQSCKLLLAPRLHRFPILLGGIRIAHPLSLLLGRPFAHPVLYLAHQLVAAEAKLEPVERILAEQAAAELQPLRVRQRAPLHADQRK